MKKSVFKFVLALTTAFLLDVVIIPPIKVPTPPGKSNLTLKTSQKWVYEAKC